MMRKALFYKATRPDGWDFHTGNTINYRECLENGTRAKCPAPNKTLGLCSSGVIHASKEPNGVFEGARIPLALFRVRGIPILADSKKYGFLELDVVEELEPTKVFKWDYAEVINPVNPFSLIPPPIGKVETTLLKKWASVWKQASAWVSAQASVWKQASAWVSVQVSVQVSLQASVWKQASAWVSLQASVQASVWAYTGSLFIPVIKEWKYKYPFQAGADLWRMGFVPSFDGTQWRLHSGKGVKLIKL